MLQTYSWFLLFSSTLFIIIAADTEHLRGKLSIDCRIVLRIVSFEIEIRFKYWLQPGTEECYHELLDNGTSIYFMYEILNAHSHDSSIVAYFRNAYNGSIVALSTTPQRGHLEIIVNETSSIDLVERE